MAKYYYVPLFLSPSMRQPGSRPTLSAYTPGITDPVTGVTTSAVAAITAAGIDLSAYSVFHGTIVGGGPAKVTGRFPAFGAGNPQNGGEQMVSNVGARSADPIGFGPEYTPGSLGPTSYRIGAPSHRGNWPNTGFGVQTLGTENFVAGEGPFGAFVNIPPGQPNPRPNWARTAILYVDTVRRMVIETPDAFVDGFFITNGWVQKTVQEVNQDYPLTSQGFPPGQRTEPPV